MTGIAAAGWAMALVLGGWALILRARLEAVARADHELRGPVAALALAAAALSRGPATRERGAAVSAQVDRLVAALGDLGAARRRGPWRPRSSEPAVVPEIPLAAALAAAAAGWAPVAGALGRRLVSSPGAGAATVAISPGRLAQAVGNLVGNALEHGSGDVTLSARGGGDRVRIEVRDEGGAECRWGRPAPRDRGRGLDIAERAAAEAGGRVSLARGRDGTVAAIDLPAAR